MREIIFRAKSIDSGEWVQGDLLQYAGTAQIWCETDNGKWNCLVDPATVGQYTGMTDRNGKKIFEGDVLDFINEYRGQNNKWKCVVEFIDGCFVCQFIEKEGHLGDYNYFGSWNVPLVQWWVVGNRWDNPELLKEAQK